MTINISSLKVMALVLVLTSSTLLSAQTPSNRYSLRAGIAFPTHTSSRNEFGNSGYTLGVSYKLAEAVNAVSSIDVDLLRFGGSDYFQGISVGFSRRFYGGAPEASSAGFIGFSAGVSYNRVNTVTASSGGSGGNVSTGISDSGFSPFGELIGGYRISRLSSVEAFYRLSSDLSRISTGAFGVRVSYSF